MWDILCSAGVGKVEHAGKNPCTCVSERMSIITGVHAQLAWTTRRLEEHVWGLLRLPLRVACMNIKWLPLCVACMNLIPSEPTGGFQRSLHVRACMQAFARKIVWVLNALAQFYTEPGG